MDFSRRSFIGGASLGLALAASAAAKPRKSVSAETKALDAIEACIDQHRADWGIPGMTVAIADRVGYFAVVTSGWADVERKISVKPDHLFQIGSISKMITALAIWSLIEDGKLSPDARLSDVLKGVSVRGGKAITLQHLLNHTSGLPADSSIFPEGGLWTGFEPGAHWSYSNCGYELAGRMASAASGALFPDIVKARVLDKLGMTASVPSMRIADRARYAQGYEPALTDRLNPRPGPMTPTPWVDSDSPAGCVAATAPDMAKFLRFLLGLAEGKGGAVFSDKTAARFLADPAEGWGPNGRYGNGIARIEVDGRRYLHHTGGMVSFCSALHVDPEAGVAAFASGNIHYSLNYRPVRVSTYACEVLRAWREGATLPARKPSAAMLEKPERFAGVFTAADGDRFEIRAAADAITMRRKEKDRRMQLATGTLFTCDDPDFAVAGVAFDLENDNAVRAWIGEKEYLADPSKGYRPPAPEALRRLAGRYDSDDRWAGPLYVYARDGALFVGNAERLTPLKKNEWRLGSDDWSPERVRFDGYVNGIPQRLLLSGAPYVRRFS
jgi:CubicO group peptidase (beta-lactamase class C family)